MKLIGLIGKKGAGKNLFADLAANWLATHGLPEPEIMAFGDALKEEVAAKTGMTVAAINANKRQFRPMLQWWGTEYRRAMFGNDYWIKRLIESNAWQRHEHFGRIPGADFIADVRFQDEARFVRSQNGILIRIIRPQFGPPDLHQSELEMDGITADHTITNTGNQVDFETMVYATMTQLFGAETPEASK